MSASIIRSFCICAACHLVIAVQASAATPSQSPVAGLSFLVGTWQAIGSGEPGHSTGEFSFEWAADRHALVRRNQAITSMGRHDDIMLVYAQPDGSIHAVYADNEGHSIEYDLSIDTGQRRVVFESVGAGPRYRLWYEAREDGSLATGFQIARPGSSDFATYLEGVARRK